MTKLNYFKYFFIIFILLILISIFIIISHSSISQKPSISPPEPTLTPFTIKKTTGTYSYEGAANNFQTYFKDSPLKESSVSFHTGNSQISFYTPQHQAFGDLNPTTSISQDNMLVYQNIFADTDLRYTILPHRLLEEFIVNGQSTALKFTRITQIAQTQNIDRYQSNADGSLSFYYQNQIQFTLPRPVIYELDNQNNRSYGIQYQITSLGNSTYQIDKVITTEGLAWLANLNRAYPIAIDFVIDSADTLGTWTSSDSTNLAVSLNTTVLQSGTGSIEADTIGTGIGSGADGACTISANTNINTDSCVSRSNGDAVNFSSTANTAIGATAIVLSSAPTGLAVGDEVLIINLQGTSSNYSHVGEYETQIITAINSNTLTLKNALTNGYDGTTQKIMVQRVPNYTNVTVNSGYSLSSTAWNGTKGGVIFFRATGTVTIGGNILANGSGYSGGTDGGTFTSQQGESIDGIGVHSASSNIGGGGGGLYNGGSAGGGGYGTAGSSSGGSSGGTTYGSADIVKLFLGSGGGAGGESYSTGCGCYSNGGPGGNGGGIIKINASSINVTGTITSNATNGSTRGGAGSGGSILLTTNQLTIGTALVTAYGSGGDGRIRLNYQDSLSGTSNPTASTNNNMNAYNDTITSTVSPVDLSTGSTIYLWVRSNRAGSYLQFQMGESLSTEQTFPFSIGSTNTWEQKTWNISSIGTTARDAITRFAFKVTNADNPFILNFDNIYTNDVAPQSPIIDYPSNNESVPVSSLLSFNLHAYDPEGDYLQYYLKLCTDLAMSVGCSTFDQTSSQTNWSGQNVGTSAYNSGSIATYNFPFYLNPTSNYYWNAKTIDPTGSNTWSPTTSAFKFTTSSPPTEATACLSKKSNLNDSVFIKWKPQSTDEVGFALQKKIDSGAFTDIGATLAAGTTGYTDSTISTGHSYQFRVAPFYSGPIYGNWCTTSILNLKLGNFRIR